jgi:hypothetical protein
MSTLFFGPAHLIAVWPYAGLLIAALLIVLQAGLTARAGKRFDLNFFREAAVFTGLLWLIYGFYERQATAIGGASAGLSAFTRFDLLVLVPILYLMTAAAVYSLFRQTRNALSRDKNKRDTKDRDEEGRS